MKNLQFILMFLIITIFITSCSKKKDPPTFNTVSEAFLTSNETTQSFSFTAQIASAGSSPISSYGVCYSTNPIPTIADQKIEHLASNGALITTYTITPLNLDNNSIFYLRGYAVNGDGVGYSQIVKVETTAVAEATTIEASPVTLTEATLNATINAKNVSTTCWFEYGETSSLGQVFQLGTFNNGINNPVSFKLSNLTPGKVIYYIVKGRNKFGDVSGNLMTLQTYEVSDIDGNMYHTVKIGTQVFLKENLKVTHYNDGTPIPNIKDSIAWGNLKTGAYCDYNNDANNGKVYGHLYNWYAVGTKKLAPVGWHIPSSWTGNNAEWDQLLLTYCKLPIPNGTWIMSCGVLVEPGTLHWNITNSTATNSTGFTALSGGIRKTWQPQILKFLGLGSSTFFWSSTELDNDDSWLISIEYGQTLSVWVFQGSIAGDLKTDGMSVRCIKD